MCLLRRAAPWLTVLLFANVSPGCGETSSSVHETNVALVAAARREDGGPRDDSAAVGIKAARLARSSSAAEGPLFESLTPQQSGVDFQPQLPDLEANIKELIFLTAFGGICTGDYDADGLVDFYVTSPAGGHRLYRNVGGMRFQDATAQAGIADDKFWGSGATFVDIDNDGDLDLYACAYDARNRLYVNQGADASGQVRFEDQASRYGLAYNGASMTMAFADIDNDGDLDGYLATTAKAPPPGTQFRVVFEGKVPKIPPHLAEYWQLIYLPGDRVTRIEAAQFDHLYRNENGRFVDVSNEAGIEGPYFTLAATWWDYNGDGLPDLYVSNDFFGPDMLYHNNGDGTFTDVIKNVAPHTPWFSMGTDVGDINNDGLVDFFATDMSATTHYREKVMMGDMDDLWFLEFAEPRQYMRNALLVNSGAGPMLEAAFLCGLASTDWTWTPSLADFDNDGRLDLFITNGILRDLMHSDLSAYAEQNFKGGSPEWASFWAKQEMRKERNLAFRNHGDLKFSRVEEEWGLGREGVSLGAATADFDNDGDLDLVVSNIDVPVSVYRNKSQEAKSALVRLVGTASNRYGLGATVRLEAGSLTQVRYVTQTRGWLSSTDPTQHFGLGDADRIDELTVQWPSGRKQTFRGLAANHLYTITEPDASDTRPNAEHESEDSLDLPQLFARADNQAEIVHEENEFDDFAEQPLLPNRLSMEGPALAAGDVDGDGDEDFFLGGAKGQAGRLLVNQGGKLEVRRLDAFAAHEDREDTAAAFFDADGDGNLDLLVTSGGNEAPAGDETYRDRIYLGDGRGGFTFAPDALPDLRDSGSVAAASDFDKDGDVDVFIGSRCIPGKYPLPPQSRILENTTVGRIANPSHTDARFVDQTPPQIAYPGMVTDALWTDLNADGWQDLVVTTDWGPVKVFLNQEGTLADATTPAGLDSLSGWWTAAAAADVDRDGDTDLIVGNFGLNTKYRASQEKPELIYYGVFDDTGKAHVVEAKFVDGVCVPRRGFSCSQNAMPFLKDKLQTYHNFASSSLADLYGESHLAGAIRLEANALESGVLFNDGRARFTFQPLPRLAQIAPSRDLVAEDFNGDGHVDLFMLQNFFGPQRETGRMDGGLSLILLGDGSGGFDPLWPSESGIVLKADPRHVVPLDLNADGRRDLIIALNGGPLTVFENRTTTEKTATASKK